MNNWSISFVRCFEGSDVLFKGKSASNIGNDGVCFRVANGGKLDVTLDYGTSGSLMAHSQYPDSFLRLRAKTISHSLNYQVRDGATMILEIEKNDTNIPHLFNPFRQAFLVRNGGLLVFNGETNYAPGAGVWGGNAMLNIRGIDPNFPSRIKMNGKINLVESRLFSFISPTAPETNAFELSGQIVLGENSSDDLYFNNASGRLIAKDLVVKSENKTRTQAIVPTDQIEFHAENTTIILTPEELGLGTKCMSSPLTPEPTFIKSLYSNAPTDTINNQYTSGIIDVGNLLITE